MNPRNLIIPLILATALAGCASRTYTYIDQKYDNEAAALKAQATHLTGLGAQLQHRPAIGSTVFVAVPSVERCYADCIKKPTGMVDVQSLAYVLKVQIKQYAAIGSYLQSTGLFEKAQVVETDNPQADALAATGYATVIYLQHTEPAIEPTWHVLKAGAEVGAVKLEGSQAPIPMLEQWLDAVSSVIQKTE